METVLFVLVACSNWISFIDTASNPLYELMTSQFKTVQLEMDILRNKVTEGEKQIAEIKSRFGEFAKTSSRGNPGKEWTGHVEGQAQQGQNQGPLLLEAFVREKQYIRQLEGRMNEWNQTVNSMFSQVQVTEKKNKARTEEKFEKAISRIPVLVANQTMQLVSEQTNELSGQFDKKILDLQTQLQHLSKQLNARLDSAVDKIQTGQKNLDERISNNFESIQELGSQGCQSGTFGEHKVPVPFPKTFTINFSPAFKKTPQFMYGLHLLDSTANVRVYAGLNKVTRSYAKVTIESWADTKLYGTSMNWIACP